MKDLTVRIFDLMIIDQKQKAFPTKFLLYNFPGYCSEDFRVDAMRVRDSWG